LSNGLVRLVAAHDDSLVQEQSSVTPLGPPSLDTWVRCGEDGSIGHRGSPEGVGMAIKSVRTFSDYQRIVEETDERKQRTISLMGLVGEIGDLHSTMKKLLLHKTNTSFRGDLREEFGDVLWYLTSLASLYRIPLQEIAEENAIKARSFYSPGKLQRFDTSYSRDEQFPRVFTVAFYEKPLKRGVYVKISVNNVMIGDALTDNAREDDGYRYHDVFHLAYAAVLGWSPVTRALLKCKRKSNSKVDEIEDGARAIIIEGAVSILVFNQGEERGWYAEPSSIDISLLKTIRKMVAQLEVRSCTAKQWQSAISQGYAAFAELKRHRGGEILVNLDRQKIDYLQTKEDSKNERPRRPRQ
jgi:NTP pyrophosphatase (non-canonical NTP hydrolase)